MYGNTFHCLAQNCKMGKGCRAMYVTVSFIMSVMKLLSLGCEIKVCVISAVENSSLQLLKPSTAFKGFQGRNLRMKSYSQSTVHKSASHYKNQPQPNKTYKKYKYTLHLLKNSRGPVNMCLW